MAINSTVQVLGVVLEEAQIVTPEQWQNVLAEHEETEKDIGQILEDEGLITAQEVAMLLSLKEQVSFVDLREHKVDPQAIRLVDGETARRYNVMPITVVNDVLIIAMEDPGDESTIDSVSAMAGMDVQAKVSFYLPATTYPSHQQELHPDQHVCLWLYHQAHSTN